MIDWIIYHFFKHRNFIPYMTAKSIFEVDYDKLYAEGCRIILTDLDNTLISYTESEPSNELINWREKLEKMGFQMMIVSNSHSKRVGNFASLINMKYQPSSFKPLKRGFKKVKKTLKIVDNTKVVVLGDQILTDILGANRMKFKPILIKAIDLSTERKSTRFNRFFERKIVKRINKKDPKGVLKDYE